MPCRLCGYRCALTTKAWRRSCSPRALRFAVPQRVGETRIGTELALGLIEPDAGLFAVAVAPAWLLCAHFGERPSYDYLASGRAMLRVRSEEAASRMKNLFMLAIVDGYEVSTQIILRYTMNPERSATLS
jgi:hypothetical protein